MIMSNELFTPSEYLEVVTGEKHYTFDGYNDIEHIQRILEENKLHLWDYPLSEVDEIVNNDVNVVLVECTIYDPFNKKFESELRWFELPYSY
jgi:hypothetical protein